MKRIVVPLLVVMAMVVTSGVALGFVIADPECYQDETVWAVGDRYVARGSWAMYVEYGGEEMTVDLRAGGGDGIGMDAGTATFSDPVDGFVDITIELENGFVFWQDDPDNPDDNIKVQDYDEAPDTRPVPGRFDWKAAADFESTSYVITVPANSFYGVHLDVAYPVPCE